MHVDHAASDLMTEEEFTREMKGSLLMLTTSSPDKREIYRLLFSAHAKETRHQAGLDLYYTDSGAMGIAPRKTAEQSGFYDTNLKEKWHQQLNLLRSPDTQKLIRRAALKDKGPDGNEFDPENINLMGMTEDSGWNLVFDSQETQTRFIAAITEKLKPRLRPQDYWLLDKLDESGFPGPNLKPLQEHMGGFHALIEMIYDVADELDIKELRFSNSTNVSFVSPRLGKFFPKTFLSTGRLLTREEYEERLMGTQKGEAINSNFVHIPDGQNNHGQKTVDMLIREGLHTLSSVDLPASYARREFTEYLQNLIGKRKSSRDERKRHVNIAFVTPEKILDGKSRIQIDMPDINDLANVRLPTHSELLRYPHKKMFDDADVVVLVPDNTKHKDNHLRSDPNLAMLLSFVVTVETDPESMSIPVVVDNRSGRFDPSLELISDAFAQGRLMGDRPFYVAHTDEELKSLLELIKDVKQRAPVIKPQRVGDENAIKSPPLEKVPDDGVFTVFVGGGHANNSKRDLDDAKAFGYYCAQHGWRIVTGAGSVEGSMGAVHTGFVQYHLDQLQASPHRNAIKASLEETNGDGHPLFLGADGKYDAEKIILDKPGMIEELANRGYIPRHMFYGYSMKPLLEMESPSGEPPPGITYFEAGNRIRRLDALLAPGTKIFLPGSIGTDEEFEETVKQHLAARLRKKNGIANDDAFADGTPDNDGAIIIYNRNGNLDKLLRHYGLSGNDPVTSTKRKRNNITIITSLSELKEIGAVRAGKWLERIKSEPGAQTQLSA